MSFFKFSSCDLLSDKNSEILGFRLTTNSVNLPEIDSSFLRQKARFIKLKSTAEYSLLTKTGKERKNAKVQSKLLNSAAIVFGKIDQDVKPTHFVFNQLGKKVQFGIIADVNAHVTKYIFDAAVRSDCLILRAIGIQSVNRLEELYSAIEDSGFEITCLPALNPDEVDVFVLPSTSQYETSSSEETALNQEEASCSEGAEIVHIADTTFAETELFEAIEFSRIFDPYPCDESYDDFRSQSMTASSLSKLNQDKRPALRLLTKGA